MFDLRELERAQEIVGAAMPPTPAHRWPLLSQRLTATVTVKHENHTPIGAFKVRGALVYVDRVKRERQTLSSSFGLTGGPSIPRAWDFHRCACDYWIPAFAGMTNRECGYDGHRIVRN